MERRRKKTSFQGRFFATFNLTLFLSSSLSQTNQTRPRPPRALGPRVRAPSRRREEEQLKCALQGSRRRSAERALFCQGPSRALPLSFQFFFPCVRARAAAAAVPLEPRRLVPGSNSSSISSSISSSSSSSSSDGRERKTRRSGSRSGGVAVDGDRRRGLALRRRSDRTGPLPLPCRRRGAPGEQGRSEREQEDQKASYAAPSGCGARSPRKRRRRRRGTLGHLCRPRQRLRRQNFKSRFVLLFFFFFCAQ